MGFDPHFVRQSDAMNPSMRRVRSAGRVLGALAAVLAPGLVLAWSPPARADIPPTCDFEDSLITCAAADVGKPCQGGGRCYAIPCLAAGATTSTTTLYKCYACATVMAAPDAGCSTTNMGTACGDGGTCTVNSSWCIGTGAKYVCASPAADQPTGPPAGEGGNGGASATGGAVGSGGSSATGGAVGSGGASATGGAVGSGGSSATGGSKSSGGGGCTVASGVPAAAGIAVGLIAIGLGLLGAGRRRRPR